MTATIKQGFVVDGSGNLFVQIAADNQWGFSIADDDQTWPGGHGIGQWTLLADDDPRITPEARERLGWLLD